jgi:hypothetical protein
MEKCNKLNEVRKIAADQGLKIKRRRKMKRSGQRERSFLGLRRLNFTYISNKLTFLPQVLHKKITQQNDIYSLVLTE